MVFEKNFILEKKKLGLNPDFKKTNILKTSTVAVKRCFWMDEKYHKLTTITMMTMMIMHFNDSLNDYDDDIHDLKRSKDVSKSFTVKRWPIKTIDNRFKIV